MAAKWPKRLVVVRHGQSELNVAKDLLEDGLAQRLKELQNVRDMDINLTSIGHWQAKETGKYLSQGYFDICFSSPYQRTLQTAQGILSGFASPPKIFEDERLREKEFGDFHGMTTESIKEHFPHQFSSRERDGKYYHRLPGGENYPDVKQRLHSFLDKLVRDWAGKQVLIVTHQVPCLLFRSLFEHLGEKQVLALGDYGNCGISQYEVDTSRKKAGHLRLKEWDKIAYDMSKASK